MSSGSANNSFVTTGSALVFIMTPGIGLFYAGLVRGRHALKVLLISYLCIAVVTIQWFLFESGSPFIGNFVFGAFANLGSDPLALTSNATPGLTFALFQLQFAAITPSIIFGSVADRLKLMPSAIFIFIWTTLVYDFISYWTWGARGWLHNLGCLSTTAIGSIPCQYGVEDFAGGGPVHISSGFAGLAFALFLGKGKGRPMSGPANLTLVFLGTALLWFGWYAFNGASAEDSSPRATMAAAVTTISASFSAMTWLIFDFIYTRKITGIGFCMVCIHHLCKGAVSGLVVITPASGFVAPWAAAVFGILSGLVVNYFSRLKERFGFDDTLDAFVGGILGSLLTGIFSQKWIGNLNGASVRGGAIESNGEAIGFQLVAIFVSAVWSFFVTYAILLGINRIPGCSFTDGDEDTDVDLSEITHDLGKINGTDDNIPRISSEA